MYLHIDIVGLWGLRGLRGLLFRPLSCLGLQSDIVCFYNIVVVGATINSKGLQARFPPADVADRLLFSALTAATEWPMDWPVRGGKRR